MTTAEQARIVVRRKSGGYRDRVRSYKVTVDEPGVRRMGRELGAGERRDVAAHRPRVAPVGDDRVRGERHPLPGGEVRGQLD